MRNVECALAYSPDMSWTLAEVLEATGGVIAPGSPPSLAFESISTDSRRRVPGALFVALSGPNHDGHRFAGDALAKGALAVVVAGVPENVAAEQAIVVPDPLVALGDLAAWTRRRVATRVIAITGSNGKTTTKEMVATICEHAAFSPPRTAVLKSVGTENNLVGVPITLLRLTGKEAVAVVEMGMNAPGEIARLVEIAEPDVGVITNVGPVHLAGVGGTIAGVAAAKGEMFAGMRSDATIVVNAEDEWVVRIAARFPGRRIEWGTGREIEARAVTDFGLDGVAFDLSVAGRAAKVRLRLVGQHNVRNACAAAAAAHAIGLELQTIRAGLEAVTPPPKRMQVVRLPNGVTVVNDSYNANPASVEAALHALAQQGGRTIAVLGEMLELGEQSAAQHQRIGKCAVDCGVRVLVAVGAQAESIADGARVRGVAATAVHVCTDPAAAAAVVVAHWRPGDVILVKGSRGPATEEVVRLRGSRMAEVVRLLEEAGRQS